MKCNYNLQYRLYSTSENEGIYVFMANSDYMEGDIWLKKNCTEPLSWIAYNKKLEDFINLIGNRKAVCSFISQTIRDRNKEKIIRLLKIHSHSDVQLMITIIDEYIGYSGHIDPRSGY